MDSNTAVTVFREEAAPSIDAWLEEAKAHPSAARIGMYLTHNGVVRGTARAQVRGGETDAAPVTGMVFSHDRAKAEAVLADAAELEGIFYIRIWLNEGQLQVGDDIMYVLLGGDTRPHVTEALGYVVGRLKKECVIETELF